MLVAAIMLKTSLIASKIYGNFRAKCSKNYVVLRKRSRVGKGNAGRIPNPTKATALAFTAM